MPRSLVVDCIAVLLFVLSVPLLAAPPSHADLSLEVTIPARTSVAEPALAFGYLRNHGPDAAENVVITSSAGRFVDAIGCVPDDAGRCVLERFPSGGEVGLRLRIEGATAPTTIPVRIEVTSVTRDPNPANNRAVGNASFVSATRMQFYLFGGTADPGQTVEYQSYITNYGKVAATDATFTLPLPAGWTFERSLSEELLCSPATGSVRCTVASVGPLTQVNSSFVLRAPNTPEGAASTFDAVKLTTANGVLNDEWQVTGYLQTSIYRHLPVTNAGDEGEGSLRHALTRANEECLTGRAPCKIVFDIAGGDSHRTIQPRTPLPTITLGLQIDGATQTARHGDTNPLGPEIVINGSLLTAGDGLDVTSVSFFRLNDVVVNGFPGNGLAIRSAGTSRVIERCYIGTDATGRSAVPNGGRGVVVEVPGQYSGANLLLRDNVISGNARSGVFLASGYEMSIHANRIGASAGERPMPLGNGASGIYVGPGASAVLVVKNIIAFNAESGIATSKPTGYLAIRANSITGNGLLGIDYGLDLVTPNPGPGTFGEVPPFPILTVARYDAATNTTRIEGHVNVSYLGGVAFVELFANDSAGFDGHGQGQLHLGAVNLSSANFTFDYTGDLRGRFITGTLTQPNSYYPELPYLRTSEFSASVRVDGAEPAPIDPAATVPRGADLLLRFQGAPRINAGLTSRMSAFVGNLGPATPENLVVELTVDQGRLRAINGYCVEVSGGLRCELRENMSVEFELEAPVGPEKVTLRAQAASDTFDPDPSNNQASMELQVYSQPQFDLKIVSSGAADPGGTASYTVYVTHRTVVDAHDVLVRIGIPSDWSLVSGPTNGWQCSIEGKEIVCRTPLFKGMTSQSFTYVLRAPGRDDGLRGITTQVRMAAAGGVPFQPFTYAPYEVFRVIRVNTIADEGSGSLRDAITRANSECAEYAYNCKIVFEIDAWDATNGVFSIRPVRPLPAIEATNVTIDARTQTAHTGDTNPLGPEVELNGSQTATGNGFDIFSNGVAVIRGFAINGFPDNGVLVRTPARVDFTDGRMMADNYIGTDPTGRMAVPNRSRGIFVETGGDRWTKLHVAGNLISGNERAGVFVASGRVIRIIGNRIDLNGASGIYLGRAEGVTIEANQIAENAHAGIAADRQATWNSIRSNATFDNGGLGVDHGLDLVTFNDDGNRAENLPRFPVLVSAVWDASAKVTRIEGRIEGAKLARGYIVEIFASVSPDGSGFGEAQRLLGEIVLSESPSEQPFTFEIAEDLRGQFVTATLTHRGADNVRQHWTSEISEAVRVP